MSSQLTVDFGSSVKKAKADARQLAEAFYASVPYDQAPAQTFKNEFIFKLLELSNRCRKAASEVLGTGTAKPVISEKVSKAKSDDCCVADFDSDETDSEPAELTLEERIERLEAEIGI